MEGAIEALIHHHKTHAVFRRSLRALTVADPQVSQAMALSRQKQMIAFKSQFGHFDAAQTLAALLQIERLCDALADDAFLACGIDEASARGVIFKVIGLKTNECGQEAVV